MITDPYNKEILYRKAQGKKIQDSYEQKILGILSNNHEKILRLHLIETDEILKKINALNWAVIQSKEYISFADCLNSFASEIYHKELHAFIDEDWKYCGAIKIPKLTKINPHFNFDKNISDELRFFSTDLSIQATIDYSSHGKTELYECTLKRPFQPQPQ